MNLFTSDKTQDYNQEFKNSSFMQPVQCKKLMLPLVVIFCGPLRENHVKQPRIMVKVLLSVFVCNMVLIYFEVFNINFCLARLSS